MKIRTRTYLPRHPAVIRWTARVRRTLQLMLGILVTLALAWGARRSILVGAAALLVVEDRLAPAEIMVVSNTMSQATALEGALLYEQRVSARIVMADWVGNPLVEKIHGLGIPLLGIAEMSKTILERSGVPSSAITVLPDQVDGTGSEVSAIAAFAQRCQPASLLVITARNHTARTKWLLQRELPNRIRVSVRSPRFDPFSVGAWWRERDQSREVITEYLRWLNTLLGDLWGRPSSGQHQTAVPDCGE